MVVDKIFKCEILVNVHVLLPDQQEVICGPHRLENLKVIVDRIDELLALHRRDIFIAFNGVCGNVGKSTIAKYLRSEYLLRHIPSIVVANLREENYNEIQKEIAFYKERFRKKHGTVFFEVQCADIPGYTSAEDAKRVREYLDGICRIAKTGHDKFDLWIAIYSPHATFGEGRFVLGDFVVRNEGAKKRKY